MKVKEDFFSNEDFLAKNRVLWEEYNERQVTRLTQKVYVIKNLPSTWELPKWKIFKRP